MKIAVCGSSIINNEVIAKKSYEIGKELAKNNVLILTGAGNGYPYEAVKGAASLNGKVFGISPAKNAYEHESNYSFPIHGFTSIEYTGLGIPLRNFPLVMESDAIIIISGQIGTLNEFSIAFNAGKVIGVLEGSGGITSTIEKIADICNKTREKYNIFYSDEGRKLVSIVIEKLKNQNEKGS